MHYHAEIIIPPSFDLEVGIRQCLEAFDENTDERTGKEFFDWWQIGGRWSGAHMEASLGETLGDFQQWLVDEKITVSGLVWGKQELQPASQIEHVDAEWSRRFPQFAGACPLFKHYKSSARDESFLVKDIPDALSCQTLVVAHPHWDKKDTLECGYLLHKEIWNGNTHQETTFTGSVKDGLRMYSEERKHYSDEYLDKISFSDDWLCVTVDYHS